VTPVLDGFDFIGFIPISAIASARSFYVDLLGLSVLEQTPYSLVVNANGTMLRLTLVEGHVPAAFTIAGWRVDDIEATIDQLVSRGVSFLRFDGLEQDERGIWNAGGDRVAWFSDPDANTLSLTEFSH